MHLFIIIGLLSCTTSKKSNPTKMEETSVIEKGITYIDINNNIYSITPNQISYRAIKKEESSSGTYSGGKDWKAKLDEETFYKIKHQVDQVFNSNAHLEKRQMMTVMLRMNGESIITKPLKDLEKVLNEFKPKE